MSAPEQVTVTQADAIAFMETAFRNCRVPHMDNDDIEDVRAELERRAAESAKAIAELVEGLRAYLWAYDRGVGIVQVAPIIRHLVAKYGGGE